MRTAEASFQPQPLPIPPTLPLSQIHELFFFYSSYYCYIHICMHTCICICYICICLSYIYAYMYMLMLYMHMLMLHICMHTCICLCDICMHTCICDIFACIHVYAYVTYMHAYIYTTTSCCVSIHMFRTDDLGLRPIRTLIHGKKLILPVLVQIVCNAPPRGRSWGEERGGGWSLKGTLPHSMPCSLFLVLCGVKSIHHTLLSPRSESFHHDRHGTMSQRGSFQPWSVSCQVLPQQRKTNTFWLLSKVGSHLLVPTQPTSIVQGWWGDKWPRVCCSVLGDDGCVSL